MKSRVHAVTQSDQLQCVIGGVESEVKSDHGDQQIFIGTVTSAAPVEESAWLMDLHANVLPVNCQKYVTAVGDQPRSLIVWRLQGEI